VARPPYRAVAEQLDAGRDVAVFDGLLAQQVRAQVLLVVVGEDRRDDGVGAEPLLDEHGAEEVGAPGDADTQAELQPMLVALLRHAFAIRRPVGVLAMAVPGLGLGEDAIRQVTAEFNAHAGTKADSIINGRDYVYWGWTTPPITVMLGMGQHIAKVFPIDYYGRQTESMPVMQRLKNYDDAGILVSIAASSMPLSWINLAQTQFGLHLGCGITAVSAADYYPYVNSGQFTGMLAGMKGAAEYEGLLEQCMVKNGMDWHLRGKGTEAMSSQAAAHLAIMAFIIVGNIAYFVTRRRKS